MPDGLGDHTTRTKLFLAVFTTAASILALYHLVQAFVVTQSSTTLNLIHVLGTLSIVFMGAIKSRVTQRKYSRIGLLSIVCVAGLAILTIAYLWTQRDRMEVEWPWISTLDIVVGLLLFFSVCVATWLAWGALLTFVGVIGILYFLFGSHLPGLLGHPEVSVAYAVSYLGTSLKTGMFWLIPLSATILFPLMVFGLVIRSTRTTEAFNEIMHAAGRISNVAPVYTCVVESGLVGMVTGGPSANVVLTGSVTIPAMKKIGLRPETAGGLEAISSTGCQLVPPIMGLAAFIMAELIGLSYTEVMIAAILPSIFFYAALVVSAYFVSQNELAGSKIKTQEVDVGKIVRLLPSFVIPLGIVVVTLFKGFSPLFACTVAIIAALVLSQTQGKYRPSFLDIVQGFKDGALLGSQVAVILMSVGFLGQALLSTGVGIRLSRIFSDSMGGNFSLSLFILMLVSLIIGMGAPTAVAYILSAIAIVPAVQDLGVPTIVAHFFAFYFASFSHMTPPVAPAVVTASRIAGSSFFATGWQAVKLAWPCFLVPYVFVFHPELLTPMQMPFKNSFVFMLYLFTVINGVASVWAGLPRLRMNALSRGILACSVLLGIKYLFAGSNEYLFATLIISAIGWGIPVTSKWSPAARKA